MQNDANEFVFKRRRKRLRIHTQGTEAVVSFDQGRGVESHLGLIPEIAVLPEPVTSSPAFPDNPEPASPEASSGNIVTVERFLRCSVQMVQRAKRAVSGAVSMKKPRAYIRHRPGERRTTSVRKVIKAPKRATASRIAKSLFRAAILTDGDPLDTLVDGAGSSLTRRPLKFVPFNKFATPFERGQTDSVELSVLDRGEDRGLHARHLGDTSDLKTHHHHSSNSRSRIPLYLVPLQEAEAAYSAMFS